VLDCWFAGGDELSSFVRLIAPVVTTTSIILSFNKIQNGDILVPANPGPPGKMAVKTESSIYLLFKGRFPGFPVGQFYWC